MCVLSMVADDWSKRIPPAYPWTQPMQPSDTTVTFVPPQVSRAEFEALKAELEALRKLLLAAKEYDAATGQPDCETGEKVALIKRLAELVGVDVSDIFAEAE